MKAEELDYLFFIGCVISTLAAVLFSKDVWVVVLNAAITGWLQTLIQWRHK